MSIEGLKVTKKGARYTPKEAEGRIPIVAKRMALEAVDLVIALERYPINSHEVERRMWSLNGQVGFLSRLLHIIWRYEGIKRGLEEMEAQRALEAAIR